MQRMRRKHSYGAGSRYCTTSWYGALRSAMCNRNYHGDTVDYRVKRCEMQQSIRRFDRRTREELMDDLSSVPLGSEQRRVLTLGLGCLRGCHFSHQRRLVRRSHSALLSEHAASNTTSRKKMCSRIRRR
ncbi:uncharacterized protein LOC135828343 isoform X2 [Sycon ciliatum]|uniref:uncharacterized protein LOC135809622 isoform X2 n=1 Tax=Sycon ciliatum TaxID=27933 RepID=UPI0031F61418